MLRFRVSAQSPWPILPSDPDRALDALLAPGTTHYRGPRPCSRGPARRAWSVQVTVIAVGDVGNAVSGRTAIGINQVALP
jgi:hypothetical protein